MTIVRNGNVSIGESNPTAKLDIRVNQATIRFSGVDCGTSLGAITFGNANVSPSCSNYSLLGEGANTFINRPAGGVLTFRENNVTQMQINSGGMVGIGTTSPDQLLTVNGNASKSDGGVTWALYSDERLKNIKGRFTPGLSTLMQLQPIRYEYKPDNALGLKGGGAAVGFSAQAVEKVLPEAVSRNEQGYLQLNSDPILWTMLNAIKEQQAQIKAQQQQLDALKKLVCQSNPQADVCKVKE